jgi:hypothetical protein
VLHPTASAIVLWRTIIPFRHSLFNNSANSHTWRLTCGWRDANSRKAGLESLNTRFPGSTGGSRIHAGSRIC